jgi:hypothetical protein
MLKFFLDKMRDRHGPLKQFRLIVGDIVEELLDIASHYIHRPPDEKDTSLHSGVVEVPHFDTQNEEGAQPISKSNQSSKRKKTHIEETSLRRLDTFPELTAALDSPANRKKQEFKVLAILWEANRRGLGELSAMDVADHGNKIGLVIRHENIRKVIRMQLTGYVDPIQNRKKGISIQQYRITPKGITYFEQKYLHPSDSN